MARKDLLTRLADAGEEALAKLSDSPGTERFVGGLHSLRDRIDELQRRLRGLDVLEERVAELERRLAAVERSQRRTASGSSAPARRGSGGSGGRTTSSKSRAKPAQGADASRGESSGQGDSSGQTGGDSPG